MAMVATRQAPTEKEQRLLEELRRVEWGSVEVIIQGGEPVRVEVRQIKKL